MEEPFHRGLFLEFRWDRITSTFHLPLLDAWKDHWPTRHDASFCIFYLVLHQDFFERLNSPLCPCATIPCRETYFHFVFLLDLCTLQPHRTFLTWGLLHRISHRYLWFHFLLLSRWRQIIRFRPQVLKFCQLTWVFQILHPQSQTLPRGENKRTSGFWLNQHWKGLGSHVWNTFLTSSGMFPERHRYRPNGFLLHIASTCAGAVQLFYHSFVIDTPFSRFWNQNNRMWNHFRI